MHRGRNVSRSLIGPILRAASYSDLQVSRSLDAFSQRMMNDTPIPTMVGFLDALEKHDETAGLWTLLRIPTLIACGDHDLLTPDEYSRKMAASLPQSELVIVDRRQPPGAAGQAGRHQRRAGPTGQADHPEQGGAQAAADARKAAAPWLSPVAAPRRCERVEDTIALGSRLGQQLRAGDVVVLSGPLGAGKTVLAKGIAAAMDVDGPVTSPSYVLARVHPPRRPGAPAMIHVDMYRLLDHTETRAPTCSVSSIRWTSTAISTTRSSWWNGVRASSSGSRSVISTSGWSASADPTCGLATWRWADGADS